MKLDHKDPDFIWAPGNRPAEREVLLETIEEAAKIAPEGVNWFVELGTFKGINARNFIIALNKLKHACLFASVDFNPLNKRLHFYPKVEWEARCKLIDGLCTQHFFEGKTVDRAISFPENRIAWLFVDACHCFDCVTEEIEVYEPKIVSGGYILFHDTNIEQQDQWVTHEIPKPGGVKKAIKKSKVLHENFEFIKEIKIKHGIQVWRKL